MKNPVHWAGVVSLMHPHPPDPIKGPITHIRAPSHPPSTHKRIQMPTSWKQLPVDFLLRSFRWVWGVSLVLHSFRFRILRNFLGTVWNFTVEFTISLRKASEKFLSGFSVIIFDDVSKARIVGKYTCIINLNSWKCVMLTVDRTWVLFFSFLLAPWWSEWPQRP